MSPTRLLPALLVLLGIVLVAGCGGGGGGGDSDGTSAPSIAISGLQFSPNSVMASTQDVAFMGGVDFTTNVDLATVRLTTSRGGDFSSPIRGAAGVRSGTAGLTGLFTPYPAGTIDFTVWLVGVDGHESNKLSGSIQIEDARPVANAGSAQNVVAGAVVTLDGSRSSDANGDALTYTWTFNSKPAGSAAALAGAATVRPAFTADVAGSYVLSLVVNDGQLNSAPAIVVVTAAFANVAPVADAGNAQSVVAGTGVTLDGSRSSDANGDPLTYAWTLVSRPTGSAAVLSGATTVSPTFTADLVGAYVAQLTVRDGLLNSPISTVVVSATARYTPLQLGIIAVIEEEVAKITTHRLDANTQMPGWLAHFEARQDWWPEFQWRQEMRKIAIEDGSRYGWANAASRFQFTSTGAAISYMRCDYLEGETITRTYYTNAIVDGMSLTVDGAGAYSLEPKITYIGPGTPYGDDYVLSTVTLERSGQTYRWALLNTPPVGHGDSAVAEIDVSGRVLLYRHAYSFITTDCTLR